MVSSPSQRGQIGYKKKTHQGVSLSFWQVLISSSTSSSLEPARPLGPARQCMPTRRWWMAACSREISRAPAWMRKTRMAWLSRSVAVNWRMRRAGLFSCVCGQSLVLRITFRLPWCLMTGEESDGWMNRHKVVWELILRGLRESRGRVTDRVDCSASSRIAAAHKLPSPGLIIEDCSKL